MHLSRWGLQSGFGTARAEYAIVFLLLLTACGGGDGGGSASQAPVAANSCVSTPANTGRFDRLSASDPGGQALTFQILDQPMKGSVTADAAGNYNYTPRSNVRGLDKFTFRARNSLGLDSNVGTVNVLIDGAVRIMPLGDSITVGTLTAATPPPGQSVGYRRKLYNDLLAFAGGRFGVNFVGSQNEGGSANPPLNDADHEGHGGACAGSPCNFPIISNNVRGWLDANPPDIVLLHAGTNDLNQSGDTSASGIAATLDQIGSWGAANYPITVFVARIIKDVPNYQTDLAVETYNANISNIVASRPNDRLVLVDMQTGANLDYGSGQPGADMADNVHPDDSGYDKMAAKWFAELTGQANIGLPRCP